MAYSVVLLAKDESVAQVRKSLDSLRDQNFSPEDIYLVTSSDRIYDEFSTESDIRAVKQTTGGIGKAREIGFSLVGRDWVFFADADTVYPEEFISQAFELVDEKNLDAVGGKIVAREPFLGSGLFSLSTNLAPFGKGHSTLIKSSLLDFSQVSENRSEDSDIWRQATDGELIDAPRVKTQVPTTNHESMVVLAFIFLGLIYAYFKS